MSEDLDMHAPRRRIEWLAVLGGFLCGFLLGMASGYRWGEREGYEASVRSTNMVHNVNP